MSDVELEGERAKLRRLQDITYQANADRHETLALIDGQISELELEINLRKIDKAIEDNPEEELF